MRIVHLFVICALVFAAAYVYRIKMESTVRTESVVKLHADIREQRDAIAALRAEMAKLETPSRLQALAERYLGFKPLDAKQYDSLKNLPERPPSYARSTSPDPIGAMINIIDEDNATGSVPNGSPSAQPASQQPQPQPQAPASEATPDDAEDAQ